MNNFFVIYIIFCVLTLPFHVLDGSDCFAESQSDTGLDDVSAIVPDVFEHDDFSEFDTGNKKNTWSVYFSDIDCYASYVAVCGE